MALPLGGANTLSYLIVLLLVVAAVSQCPNKLRICNCHDGENGVRLECPGADLELVAQVLDKVKGAIIGLTIR